METFLFLLPSLIALFFFKVFDECEQESELSKWRTKSEKLNNWLNKNTSWKNKHNMKPTWLFKTALVWVTDGEHFFQMLKHISTALAFGLVFVSFSLIVAVSAFFFALGAILLASFIMNELVF